MAAPVPGLLSSGGWSNSSAQLSLSAIGSSSGDILVLHACIREGQTLTMDSSGWTLIGHNTTSGNIENGSNTQGRHYLWMKVSEGDGLVAVTPSANTFGRAHLTKVTGAATSPLPDVHQLGSNGFSSSPIQGGLTPTAAESLVCCYLSTNSGGTGAADQCNHPTGTTELYDEGDVTRSAVHMAHLTHGATATGDFTWATADGGNTRWVGSVVSFKPAGGGGPEPLEAAAGSFTLTGQAAGLKVARKLTAAAGTFSLSGQAAALTADRLIAAGAGSFALNGRDAGLIADRILAGAAGTYALTGQDVDLRRGRTLIAESGIYTLSGQTAALLADRSLLAEAASFTLAGQDADLRRDRTLVAATGTYTLTGNAAGLIAGRSIAAETGTFALSGIAAGLETSRRLTADAGAFVLSGQDAILVAGEPGGSTIYILLNQAGNYL